MSEELENLEEFIFGMKKIKVCEDTKKNKSLYVSYFPGQSKDKFHYEIFNYNVWKYNPVDAVVGNLSEAFSIYNKE